MSEVAVVSMCVITDGGGRFQGGDEDEVDARRWRRVIVDGVRRLLMGLDEGRQFKMGVGNCRCGSQG